MRNDGQDRPADRPLDRRTLLASGLGALGGLAFLSRDGRAAVRLLAPSAARADDDAPRTLVLLQLSGGNDGLSTVVPFGDDLYAKARSSTRIAAGEALALDGYRGLHPELKRLHALYGQGSLAVVEGAGYPKPIRSHFESMEVWHTARGEGRDSGEGWVGRLCDAAWPKDATPELVVHLGATAPYSLYSTRHPALAFQTPASYQWVASEREDKAMYERAGAGGKDGPAGDAKPKTGGAAVLDRLRGVLSDAQESSLRIRRAAAGYRPRVEYPQDELGNVLRVAAALIDARIGARVISVELGGFDSHNDQRRQHDGLMRRLDAGLAAFLADLRGTRAGDACVVVAFSEFGRRVAENGSRGTDHGTAGPMLVAGTAVQGGLYGKHPSLAELDDGDLVHTTDFRSVYGEVVEGWFGARAETVLGGRYPALPLLG